MKSQTINVLGHRDVYCATAPNVTEVCIFNVFAHEILPVNDAVWRWQSFIYEEFKDIFEENKQGSDDKAVLELISSHLKWPTKQNRREVSCWRRPTAFSWEESHFCFYF